jgi:methionine-rich copper-binding protein CopC
MSNSSLRIYATRTRGALTPARAPGSLAGLPVPALPSGRYKVTWHVVSVDTHPTQGDFTFEIKP